MTAQRRGESGGGQVIARIASFASARVAGRARLRQVSRVYFVVVVWWVTAGGDARKAQHDAVSAAVARLELPEVVLSRTASGAPCWIDGPSSIAPSSGRHDHSGFTTGGV